MKLLLALACVLALALVGCEEQRIAAIADGGIPDLTGSGADLACATAAPDGATWSYLYANYFGGGTPGHCGASGCHEVANVGGGGKWVCGDTSDSCYQGMLKKTLLDPAHPTASAIASPTRSPLQWFNSDTGNMPKDNLGPNSCAARDIVLWLDADGGATEN